MFAGLVLLHALAEATETTQDNKEEFLNAVVQGKDEDVKRMLQANSSLVGINHFMRNRIAKPIYVNLTDQ